MGEQSQLDVQLNARYATTVRSVVASLAAALGMSIDEIDDLRLGVNEAISLLTDVDDDGGAGRLHVRFDTEPGQITVSAHRSGLAESVPVPEIDVLAARILGAVVDEFSIADDGLILLVKRVPTDGDS